LPKAALFSTTWSAGRRRDAKHRLKIIDRVTDLFAAGSRSYSDEQISLFDDVLRRLAADIEIKARAKLAHRLAVIDNAPPVLIRSLAFDDAIEVAEPAPYLLGAPDRRRSC
jgi:uncharacterized protein (DUF2336 family)